MIHKTIKMLLGVVILAAMTTSYASNTGTIKVTNKYTAFTNPLWIAVQGIPQGWKCWSASGVQYAFNNSGGLGRSAEFTDLDTDCAYRVTGLGPIQTVDFESGKKSFVELMIDAEAQVSVAESH